MHFCGQKDRVFRCSPTDDVKYVGLIGIALEKTAMKMTLVFVPQGGGEADYSLEFDLPGVPQHGDYISVRRPETQGTADFIVRRTWWGLSHPETRVSSPGTEAPLYGKAEGLMVECEYAIGPHSSDSHKTMYEAYVVRKGIRREFDETAY